MRRALLTALCLAALAPACTYDDALVAPELPPNAESSSVYAADGTLITTFRAEQNRVSLSLHDIPLILQNAVIAIEDERFWEHSGIDARAILRAGLANAGGGGISQGGSTITQQYISNTLLQKDDSLDRKIKEASLALQLERAYSKEVILELYLNTVYFGNGAYGVEAAAREYFGVGAGEVTLEQAALLAGVIHAPEGEDDPDESPTRATARRNVVLDEMLEQSYITDEAHAAASETPLTLAPNDPATQAQAPYPAAHFVEEVKQWFLDDPRFGATDQDRYDLLFGGGLRIYTTVDLGAQAHAEAVVNARLEDPSSDPNGALVALDPRTGYVRAMVGGRDFFAPEELNRIAKLNLAVGKGRSTGSAFKPIVLATALSEGIRPEETFPSPSATVLRGTFGSWSVRGGGGLGQGNLVECTVHSSNTCYANLILDERVGPDLAIDYAHRLGITTPLESVPAAVLGANDATVLDMASVYSTFANRGLHTEPVLVTRIVRADGSVLYENDHAPTRVLQQNVADEVTRILTGVVDRGTGTSADIGRPAAGKTGSAQNNTDAWFVGYTPELVTAVWVGYAELRDGGLVPMRPPNTPITVFGGKWPAEIWRNFMEPMLALVPPSQFPSSALSSMDGTGNSGAELFPLEGNTQTAEMPDVRGLNIDEARAALDGFEVGVSYVTDPASIPGFVLAQSPAPGTRAVLGGRVAIEVVRGARDPSTEGAPDVVGKTHSDAQTDLRSAGFDVTIIQAEIGDVDDDGDVDASDRAQFNGELPPDAGPDPAIPWPDVGRGRVWRQTPAPGVPTDERAATIWIRPE